MVLWSWRLENLRLKLVVHCINITQPLCSFTGSVHFPKAMPFRSSLTILFNPSWETSYKEEKTIVGFAAFCNEVITEMNSIGIVFQAMASV